MLLSDFVGEVQKLIDENDRLVKELAKMTAMPPQVIRYNRPKLTPREVQEIRRLHSKLDWSQRDLADAFDVNPATISRIVRGQYHKAVA